MSVSGLSTLSMSAGGAKNSISNNSGIYTLNDSATWSHGKHVVKFGANLMHLFFLVNATVSNAVYGSYTFNGSITGVAFADFLLGNTLPVEPPGEPAGQPLLHPGCDCALYQRQLQGQRQIDAGVRAALGSYHRSDFQRWPDVQLRSRRESGYRQPERTDRRSARCIRPISRWSPAILFQRPTCTTFDRAFLSRTV